MKLEAIGICGKVLHWIQNWLVGRQQQVYLSGTVSDWKLVKSGIPQGSVLGPLLFVIFINDIDIGLISNLLKFADDVKLFKPVLNSSDMVAINSDLTKLSKWCEMWQMDFNVEKCKSMHIGSKNPEFEYTINGKVLKSIKEERDLGVIMNSNFKVSSQCNKAVKSANRMLGFIKRNIKCKDEGPMMLLYKGMVRPHLEYCIQAWRPNLIKDIDIIEGVQRRFTKLIHGLSNKSYEYRLRFLGLTTLEERRNRGDLIEVYKLVRGIDDLDCLKLDKNKLHDTRGHKYKLVKKSFNKNVGKWCFSNRVVNDWNMLSSTVVESACLSSFKINLDRYLSVVRGLYKL